MTDEEFQKAPDWSYWTPARILKKKCDCPDFCERRVVGSCYSGSTLYLCKNCGQIYKLKGLRPIRIPEPKKGRYGDYNGRKRLLQKQEIAGRCQSRAA